MKFAAMAVTAFVGALLVKNEEQLEMLRSEGPWKALQQVTRSL